MKRQALVPVLFLAGVGVVFGLVLGDLPLWVALGAALGMATAFHSHRRQTRAR